MHPHFAPQLVSVPEWGYHVCCWECPKNLQAGGVAVQKLKNKTEITSPFLLPSKILSVLPLENLTEGPLMPKELQKCSL